VASLIQRIAASASKQTESSTVVLEFMQKVSDAVRTNLSEMQEVTRATEFTTIEVTKLDSLVNQLNQVVGQFRIDDGSVPQGDIDVMTAQVSAGQGAAPPTMPPMPARSGGSAVPMGLAPMPEAALADSMNEPAPPEFDLPPSPEEISEGGGKKGAA